MYMLCHHGEPWQKNFDDTKKTLLCLPEKKLQKIKEKKTPKVCAKFCVKFFFQTKKCPRTVLSLLQSYGNLEMQRGCFDAKHHGPHPFPFKGDSHADGFGHHKKPETSSRSKISFTKPCCQKLSFNGVSWPNSGTLKCEIPNCLRPL